MKAMNPNCTTEFKAVIFSKKPDVCGGRWCIDGHRIWPELIKKLGIKKSMSAYPHLTEDEVRAAYYWKNPDPQ